MRTPTWRMAALAATLLLRATPGPAAPEPNPAPSERTLTPAEPAPNPQVNPPPTAGQVPLLETEAPAARQAKREKETVRDLFAGQPTTRITLNSAIEMALQNNLDVRFEKAGIALQRAQVKFALGAFDPVFNLSAQYQHVERPQDISNPTTTTEILQQQALQTQLNSAAQQLQAAQINTAAQLAQQQAAIAQQLNTAQALSGATSVTGFAPLNTQSFLNVQPITNPVLNNIVVLNQQGFNLSSSFSGRLGWGTRYALQASSTESRNTFTGDINPVRSIYEDSVGLQIQQPLLRNFGADANLADVRTARIGARVQTLVWKNNISTAIQGVMAAYYNMDFALQNIRVQEDAVAADSKLVALYERRVEVGFGSPFDVRQAQVQVSGDREQLLLSKNVFLTQQFALKRLVLSKFDVNDPRLFFPESVMPLDAPRADRTTLLRQAFENRYDYRGQVLNAEIQNIRLRFAKNQLLPELDLVATYGINGLGWGVDTGLSDTFSGNHPQWTIGLQFQVPIGNRQARAQYEAALAQKEQAILRIKQSELTVGVDVDTALSLIETNRQRLVASRNSRELGEEAVRIAFRRLEEGQISAYEITDQQRKLYDAKSRELGARADLSRAVTTLWLATGRVLQEQGITFNEPKDILATVPPAPRPKAAKPTPAPVKRR